MILPIDEKAGFSDDEDDYLDYDDALGLDLEAGYPCPYPYPHAAYCDVVAPEERYLPPYSHQLAYPPPYSPRAEFEDEKPPTLSGRLAAHLSRAASGLPQPPVRFILVAVCVLFFYSLHLPLWHHGWHRGPPPLAHGASLWESDGAAVRCAQLEPAVPADEVAVTATREAAMHRSVNTTFALPLAAHELFVSLRAPAAHGVHVTTYDEALALPADDSVITIDGDSTGPRVLVTVEAVYDGPADGWDEALAASRVCLMERNGTSPHQPGPRRNRPVNPRSLGVGVYTSTGTTPEHSPLAFNIHIAVPLQNSAAATEVHVPQRRSVVGVILNALAADLTPPAGLVPPLSIRAAASDVHVGNLTGAALSGLQVDTSVGDIVVGYVRAEGVHLKTVGTIMADVAVSQFLDIESPAGTIDLNVSTVRSPEFGMYRYPFEGGGHRGPPPPPPQPAISFEPECALPPVAINVHGNSNDHITIRHADWEVPCRPVSALLHSSVGNIDVHPHPLLEGQVRLTTTVGTVDVRDTDLEDPLDLGRHRRVSLTKTSRRGAEEYSGSVHWLPAEAEAEAGTDASPTAASAGVSAQAAGLEGADDGGDEPEPQKTGRGARHRGPHHPPPWAPGPPGLMVTTSVGDIQVDF